LAIVLTAACGGDDKKKAAPKATTTTATPTTAAAAPASGAPLTGVAGGDAAKLARPALITKIDNAPNGRPQAGINQADVVFEEGVEGGITRLAVVFHSQDADEVGPVRSARTTDILIASALNKPLFAWSGSNADFVKLVRAAPLVDVGVDVKGGAYFYNVGRGATVDQEALLAALRSGRLAGVGLDVTDPEPLPADSPFWAEPAALITAHSSGHTPRSAERWQALLLDNLHRFAAGEPLRNVVDKRLGY
jgi:hypothetical protein